MLSSKHHKEDAVLFYERGHTFAETKEKYGMAESTFFEWEKKYDQEHSERRMGGSNRNAEG